MDMQEPPKAEAKSDGTIVISARGQEMTIFADEAKDLLKEIALSLAQAQIALKLQRSRERPNP